jgi:hypothetical protein
MKIDEKEFRLFIHSLSEYIIQGKKEEKIVTEIIHLLTKFKSELSKDKHSSKKFKQLKLWVN